MRGDRGKLFWRKVSPGPLSKDFWARGRVDADPGFYRCGSAVAELVRSTVGDPDLRSPSGFDFGLRPPLRMTRRGGVMLFHCGGNHYAMVVPTVFIDI